MSSGFQDEIHAELMREAIAEAERARGRTSPNPMVGAIVAREGEVIARGYHARAGEAHGEVDALRKLGGRAPGADLYVNLEPCCHHGRTPPCTEAILAAGITRVFVGTLDPYSEVSGRGVAQLREAGVEVHVGVEEEASRALNRPFFKRVTTGLPWVTVKYAMTLDGKIATKTGHSAWITGEEAREQVHGLRDIHDAIMVGTHTLLADDPRLTCRIAGGEDPLRVIMDARLRVSAQAKVYEGLGEAAEALLITSEGVPDEAVAERVRRGVGAVRLPVDDRGHFDLVSVLEVLADRGVSSVFVEGGGELLGALMDARLVDECYVYVAPVMVGGRGAKSAVAGEGVAVMSEALELVDVDVTSVGRRDVLIHGFAPDSWRARVESMLNEE